MSTPSTGLTPFSDSKMSASGNQKLKAEDNFEQTLQEETNSVVVQHFSSLIFSWFNTVSVTQTIPNMLQASGIQFYQHIDNSIRVSLKETHQLPVDIAFYDSKNKLNITITVAAELFSAFSNSRIELEKKLKKRLGRALQINVVAQ